MSRNWLVIVILLALSAPFATASEPPGIECIDGIAGVDCWYCVYSDGYWYGHSHCYENEPGYSCERCLLYAKGVCALHDGPSITWPL